jgi:Anti-sigma-K factor rskA
MNDDAGLMAEHVPPELEKRVLADLDQPLPVDPPRTPQVRPEPGAGYTMAWGLGLAAALCLAAGLGALWWAARQDMAILKSDQARLEAQLKEQERDLAWLKDPRVQVALLKGQATASTAHASLLWHPETKQGILYVNGLPPLPLEKSYELWAFVDGRPFPAGTFDAHPGGVTVFAISRQESLGEKPTKFAVSIEPKGGVPAPTGSVVLMGDAL